MQCVLTIAGSDSSGGAGIQADLKTFEHFGCYGASAITVLTAQNTLGVTSIYPVDPAFVQAQIQAVMDDFPIKAIKIGMLFDTDIIQCVKEFLLNLEEKIPVVLDPVARANSGAILLEEHASNALKELFPLATLITPNLKEFEYFFGVEIQSVEQVMEIHHSIHEKAQSDLVIKNIQQENHSIDFLIEEEKCTPFKTPWLTSASTHGSGCTFSSAIAAGLAQGEAMEDAIQQAKHYVHEAIMHAPPLGHGGGPLRHNIMYHLSKEL